MLSKKKIRLMTKLAIYDKNYGALDKKNSDCFMWDYIYFKNFRTRTGVLFGGLILTLFYAFKRIIVDEADLLTLDFKSECAKIGFAIACLMIVYTFIGTQVAKKEYNKSRERLTAYFVMLDKLDRQNAEEPIVRTENPEKGNSSTSSKSHYDNKMPADSLNSLAELKEQFNNANPLQSVKQNTPQTAFRGTKPKTSAASKGKARQRRRQSTEPAAKQRLVSKAKPANKSQSLKQHSDANYKLTRTEQSGLGNKVSFAEEKKPSTPKDTLIRSDGYKISSYKETRKKPVKPMRFENTFAGKKNLMNNKEGGADVRTNGISKDTDYKNI